MESILIGCYVDSSLCVIVAAQLFIDYNELYNQKAGELKGEKWFKTVSI